MALLLAGDIGGTNSRFSLFDATSEDLHSHECVFRRSYKNAEFDSFTSVLDTFIKDAEAHLEKKGIAVVENIQSGCLAVAGPVQGNVVTFTNSVNRTAFVISAAEVERHFHIKVVKLLNDFVANGYGLLTLRDAEVTVIKEAKNKIDEPAPIACIGAGTGLGECYLTPNTDGTYTAFPSEGGHAEFSPRNDLEVKLLQFLQKKFTPHPVSEGQEPIPGRVSVERIVSGKGLVNVYEFLASQFPEKVDLNYKDKILGDPEGGKIIADRYHEDSLCHEALNIMLSTYGSEAGTVCLKYLPYGGLYIAGGIAPVHEAKIVDPHKSDFLAAFHDKGRVSGVLDNIKVSIVKAGDLGLRGAHFVADSLYRRGSLEPAKEKAGEEKPRVKLPTCCSQSEPCIKTKKIVELSSVPRIDPVGNPMDSVFYFCGVASISILAGLGLASLYKTLTNNQ